MKLSLCPECKEEPGLRLSTSGSSMIFDCDCGSLTRYVNNAWSGDEEGAANIWNSIAVSYYMLNNPHVDMSKCPKCGMVAQMYGGSGWDFDYNMDCPSAQHEEIINEEWGNTPNAAVILWYVSIVNYNLRSGAGK